MEHPVDMQQAIDLVHRKVGRVLILHGTPPMTIEEWIIMVRAEVKKIESRRKRQRDKSCKSNKRKKTGFLKKELDARRRRSRSGNSSDN